MKTTLCFTLTLLIFAMLAFVPSSFAQDSRPIVRLIYFVPSNRQPRPNIDTQMDKLIKDVQQGYEDIMEAHEFGKKTFQFEMDVKGNAVVHTVNGQYTEKHYNDEQYIDIGEISREVQEQLLDNLKNIYLVAIDVNSPHLGGSAQIGGIAQSYYFHEGGGGLALMPASGHNFSIRVAAHELGHTFGLNHDVRSDAQKVTVDIFDRTQDFYTSFCAAEWLDVSRFFNVEQPISNEKPTIDMLPPSFVSSSNVIRLRFKITDHDGIHQVQLETTGPKVGNTTTGHVLLGCVNLNGNSSATVEFVTSSLTPQNEILRINMIDVQGNLFKSELYPIDVLSLLPPPEAVSIPDPILRTALRNSLNLASDEPITQLNILDLRRFGVPYNEDKKVKDLTGLEYASNLRDLWIESAENIDITPITSLNNLHRLSLIGSIQDITPIAAFKKLDHLAVIGSQIQNITLLTQLTQLSSLNLSGNQISGITPLAKLTNLTFLSMGGNKISDITPLAKLTRLTELNLSANQIRNIRPLAGLTNLNWLGLSNNQIKDLGPLTGLVSLQVLHLEGNPIEDKKPLLELLEKKPDIKIYLKAGGEPLPVNLSRFRAELIDTGVLLKWTTESEVDNAGFYIYRSQTKDGDFEVVNPKMIQGAGTTGERTEYTWTDTTAKPNTVYYYQIEDVSHAGEREQLATVRLRGLVSARGKLITRWSDLKQNQKF